MSIITTTERSATTSLPHPAPAWRSQHSFIVLTWTAAGAGIGATIGALGGLGIGALPGAAIGAVIGTVVGLAIAVSQIVYRHSNPLTTPTPTIATTTPFPPANPIVPLFRTVKIVVDNYDANSGNCLYILGKGSDLGDWNQKNRLNNNGNNWSYEMQIRIGETVDWKLAHGPEDENLQNLNGLRWENHDNHKIVTSQLGNATVGMIPDQATPSREGNAYKLTVDSPSFQ